MFKVCVYTEQTIKPLLWHSIYSTNDVRSKLTGQPYDNQNRQYTGSNNETALNKNILRYNADVTA